ncbi:MAG: YbjN domain-containing protein [Caldilineaceae bacterium]|nr:YbjN domain-containing protein [Caldilineaceae bacterium]
MATLLESLKEFFTQDEWHFEEAESQPLLRMEFWTEENAWSCYAQALEEEQQFVFYSIAPVTITRPKLWLGAEYLLRANYNLILGNFEMDMDSGLVRFKTSIDVEGDRLSYSLFRPVVYANLSMMARYLPGLQAVVFEDAAPQVALATVEN